MGPALTALFVAERDFLPGEDAPWIDEVRDQLTEVRLRALECYAAAGLGIGETELAAAVRAAGSSPGWLRCGKAGTATSCKPSPPRAIWLKLSSVYGQLSDRLRDQLGVSPSPDTRQLYERLLAAT